MNRRNIFHSFQALDIGFDFLEAQKQKKAPFAWKKTEIAHKNIPLN